MFIVEPYETPSSIRSPLGFLSLATKWGNYLFPAITILTRDFVTMSGLAGAITLDMGTPTEFSTGNFEVLKELCAGIFEENTGTQGICALATLSGASKENPKRCETLIGNSGLFAPAGAETSVIWESRILSGQQTNNRGYAQAREQAEGQVSIQNIPRGWQ